ncbi:hypothetical protein BDQ12DRAFT_691901 [Crucibulum laeve]|uniref:Uncharacterized protein n=1 Tax=Crucibulum laeve TaxID=68775 RepID=A0A5C3LJX3_9AGAR|nr:hypothetical protein BDQ12DRAFT_691901 [Crucibulum laeve]
MKISRAAATESRPLLTPLAGINIIVSANLAAGPTIIVLRFSIPSPSTQRSHARYQDLQ